MGQKNFSDSSYKGEVKSMWNLFQDPYKNKENHMESNSKLGFLLERHSQIYVGSIPIIKKTIKLCEDPTKTNILLDRMYDTLEVKLQNKIVKHR